MFVEWLDRGGESGGLKFWYEQGFADLLFFGAPF
jgi:hypothetical protein